MNATTAAVALIAQMLAAVLPAQPVVATGTRVRLWLPDSVVPAQVADVAGLRIGSVAAMDSATLVLRAGTATHRVPLASLARLDVSEGRPSHRTAGAVIGGLVSGALFVGAACGFSDGSCDVNSGNVGGFLAYYAIGALPGVFIGRAVGGRMHGEERWREVWRRP